MERQKYSTFSGRGYFRAIAINTEPRDIDPKSVTHDGGASDLPLDRVDPRQLHRAC
jgi:hypothetical protein